MAFVKTEVKLDHGLGNDTNHHKNGTLGSLSPPLADSCINPTSKALFLKRFGGKDRNIKEEETNSAEKIIPVSIDPRIVETGEDIGIVLDNFIRGCENQATTDESMAYFIFMDDAIAKSASHGEDSSFISLIKAKHLLEVCKWIETD